MKKADVILGLQWGDEGKGKVVDVLTPRYRVVARFQGGPNAGHSLRFDGKSFILSTIPSGIFRNGVINIIGNGMVVDPNTLVKEIHGLEAAGVDVMSKLYFSKKAHLILPTHRALDAAAEAAKGETKIGSTLKGIGPAYMDKTGRNALRMGDILAHDFKHRYARLRDKHIHLLGCYGFEYEPHKHEKEWFEAIDYLRKFAFIDSEYAINDYIDEGIPVLAEGAQGTLLDIDFGTYPYVTSSTTTCAGVCTGLGVAPTKIGNVYGIFKAYATRVGGGPFPTELFDETGKRLREIGKEFGSVTGRERRCGWLDLVALRYAVMLNGVTELIMMKADVLNGFDTIKVAVDYDLPDGQTNRFPYEVDGGTKPVYRELKGWNTDICNVRRWEDFPAEFKTYVEFIERYCGVPVMIISVGPDREETIIR
ncbi:MAG: adenylosuccinate synthase [Rikenellaceae bacterium]|nr:adenylosuccinate synthase [Rikenellaceae bacterium]MCL2693394.1 adenylosuccinate synthase [Rikenellaceae bacterium]